MPEQNIPHKQNRTIAIISILFVVLIWGSAFAVSKVGVTELPPLFMAFVRNAVAVLALLPFYLVVRKKAKAQNPVPLPVGRLIILALTGITLFFCFFNAALTYTGAASASLIQGLMPLLIAVPAAVFLKEKFNAKMIAGIIISVAGVTMVGFIGQTDNKSSLLGNFMMIGAVACWTVYTLMSRQINRYHPVPVIFFVTLIGTILLIPGVIYEGWHKPLPYISQKGWTAIIYLGLMSSAIGYLLYNRALRSLTAAQAGNFLNLEPVVGSVIALIFLHEHFSTLQFIGGALVLIGVFLSSAKHEA